MTFLFLFLFSQGGSEILESLGYTEYTGFALQYPRAVVPQFFADHIDLPLPLYRTTLIPVLLLIVFFFHPIDVTIAANV